MLAIWSLMHGTALLIIRGRFEGALRTQAVHACVDAVEAVVACSARNNGLPNSGPRWPASLVLGEGKQSHAGNGKDRARKGSTTRKPRP